jgi:hypothetical protein
MNEAVKTNRNICQEFPFIATGTSGNVEKCGNQQFRTSYLRIDPSAGRIEIDYFAPTVNAITACVSSAATIVGVYYDPMLAQREMRTMVLNEALRLGFVPPSSKTTE